MLVYFSDAPIVLSPGHSDEHSPVCVSEVCRTSPYGQQSWLGLKTLTMFVEQLLWTQVQMSLLLVLP